MPRSPVTTTCSFNVPRETLQALKEVRWDARADSVGAILREAVDFYLDEYQRDNPRHPRKQRSAA